VFGGTNFGFPITPFARLAPTPLSPALPISLHIFTTLTLPALESWTALMSLAITPIVKVTMAEPSPTKAGAPSLADRVAALNLSQGGNSNSNTGKPTDSPGTITPQLSNPLSPMSPTAPGGSPFGNLAGVKDDGTNIGGAAARKASVHERASFTTTSGTERKGSSVHSRRPSRRGSGVITTPSGQQVFHTRTNVGTVD
jgi:hypothetical protein